jgi:hypothetical protein
VTLPFDPVSFVQRQLDAYNARDLARFVREFRHDVVVLRLPDVQPSIVGREALAAHYRDNRFNLPDLHAELVNRMAFGNKVIDQEIITGLPTGTMHAAVVYEVTPDGIAKVWLVGAS